MKPRWGQFFMTQRGQFRAAFDTNIAKPCWGSANEHPLTTAARERSRCALQWLMNYQHGCAARTGSAADESAVI
jgi:hypothetical protein